MMTKPATASLIRCSWAQGDDLCDYHDVEWGVPVHDDSALFELITLEGAQAGLSWLTVLRRRDGYRRAFAHFDPRVVAKFNGGDVERLLLDEGIIRHRGKIESTIANANAVLALQREGDSLDATLWSFAPGRPSNDDLMAGTQSSTSASTALSKRLKHLGFGFVGPTTCYSLMQAAGFVNDHQRDCFRFNEIAALQ